MALTTIFLFAAVISPILCCDPVKLNLNDTKEKNKMYNVTQRCQYKIKLVCFDVESPQSLEWAWKGGNLEEWASVQLEGNELILEATIPSNVYGIFGCTNKANPSHKNSVRIDYVPEIKMPEGNVLCDAEQARECRNYWLCSVDTDNHVSCLCKGGWNGPHCEDPMSNNLEKATSSTNLIVPIICICMLFLIVAIYCAPYALRLHSTNDSKSGDEYPSVSFRRVEDGNKPPCLRTNYEKELSAILARGNIIYQPPFA